MTQPRHREVLRAVRDVGSDDFELPLSQGGPLDVQAFHVVACIQQQGVSGGLIADIGFPIGGAPVRMRSDYSAAICRRQGRVARNATLCFTS